MFNSFNSSPKLSVQLDSTHFYLFPSSSPSLPAPDLFIRGHLSLSLPRPRSGFTLLRATLIGETTYHLNGRLGDGRRSQISERVLSRTVDLRLDPQTTFEGGEHGFQFSFRVPASAALSHESDYGSTCYWIVGHLESGGGGGLGRKQIFKSKNTAIQLVPNPTLIGEVPEEINALVSTRREGTLGDVHINASSPYLSISSLLLLSASFPLVQSPLTILSIAGYIQESVTITLPTSLPTLFELRPPPRRHLLFESSPRGGLARLEKGDEWEFQRLARLPGHEELSFSTNEGSAQGIRVKHHAVVEVRYLVDGAAKENTLTMGTRVRVASCQCPRDSLLPPLYSAEPPNPLPTTTESCLCSVPLAQLMKGEQKSSLQRFPHSSTSSAHGLRSEKSPSVGDGRGWH